MRLSDFWRNMDHEFGPRYSRVLAETLALSEFNSMTANEALNRGVQPREVWQAICKAQDVPSERWLGPDIEIKE
ncbi:DUF3046 domain-containing protein [Glutamicibacter uratoxydans]|uniref:DUF3046 domain-containing protein n=1 Tax=Glutamicibacter uratoxydans TaxID=43667 RepID=UPI003D6E3ABA